MNRNVINQALVNELKFSVFLPLHPIFIKTNLKCDIPELH